MLISVPADVAGVLTVEVIAARALVEGAEELAELPDPECAVRVVHAWWNCGRRCTVCHQAVGGGDVAGNRRRRSVEIRPGRVARWADYHSFHPVTRT
jgi:hypothetical protein